jgi:peptidoglycan/LPS O-acetylase OafA/YrhL
VPEQSKTFDTLQAGRGLAALMVVFYHCHTILSEGKYWNHSWKQYLLFGHSGVEFFFVLSGIVILNAHWADQGHPDALKSYVWKRFRRIYPIYWLVLAFVLPVFHMMPSFGTGVERRTSVILSSLLLVHVTDTNTVLTVAWTLYHEIMFYVIFAFVIVNRVFGLSLLGIWMACALASLFLAPANPLLGVYLSPLHLLFGFGMIAMLIVRRSKVPYPQLLLIVGLAGFVATSVHENLAGHASSVMSICYGLNGTLCALGSMELERSGRIIVPPILRRLGDASYSIYLVHLPALSLMAKLIYPLWLRVKVPIFLPFMLLAIGSLAAGLLVYWFVERPLLKFVRMPERSFRLRTVS